MRIAWNVPRHLLRSYQKKNKDTLIGISCILSSRNHSTRTMVAHTETDVNTPSSVLSSTVHSRDAHTLSASATQLQNTTEDVTLPYPASEMTIAFDSILNLPHVHCRDRAQVERKLKEIVADGTDRLMVISDFDYTLSRAVDEKGVHCWTTHGVFDHCADQVDKGLSQKFKDLKAHYYPIEFDPHMSMEEKTPHMENWWRTSHNHIAQAGFTRQIIDKFVSTSNVKLRDGADRLVRTLNTLRIPLVVFSAGIGDIIEMFFQHQFGKMLPNIHIIANMMQYNQKEEVVGFSEPLIHTFCKNSTVIHEEASFFSSTIDRHNILLMGDSLGDLHMDVGVPKEGHTLRIGFLNFYKEDLMEKFLHGYDIVIVNDQSMHIPEKIVSLIEAVTVKSQGA